MGRTAGANPLFRLCDALPLDKSRYLDPACLLFRCALVGAPRANRLLLLIVSSRFFATSLRLTTKHKRFTSVWRFIKAEDSGHIGLSVDVEQYRLSQGILRHLERLRTVCISCDLLYVRQPCSAGTVSSQSGGLCAGTGFIHPTTLYR